MRKLALSKGWAIVGHNRKATRGTINDANAHPFWVDNKTVLVHNGTMFGDHKKHADTEVDSHAIAHVLSSEEDVEKALQSINAAYALIWYDVPTKQLNVIRNKDRPLSHSSDNRAWYIASEGAMLDFVLSRNSNTKVETRSFPVGNHHIWELQGDRSSKLSYADLDLTPKHQAYGATVYHGACAWEGWGSRMNDDDVETIIIQNFPSHDLRMVTNLLLRPWHQRTTMAATHDRMTIFSNNSFIRIEVKELFRKADGSHLAFCTTTTVNDSNPLIVMKMSEYQVDAYQASPEKNSAYYASVSDYIWSPGPGDTGYSFLEVVNPARIIHKEEVGQ